MRRLPVDMLGTLVDNTVTIPLSLLEQSKPAGYRLGAGDILGVYIEGVLGERGQPLPFHNPDSPRITRPLAT